jgi:predicted transcriptional regulator
MDKPETSVFDPATPGAEEQALRQAEADLAAGRTVPHDDVVRWLRSWGKPGELPPPKSRQWRR